MDGWVDVIRRSIDMGRASAIGCGAGWQYVCTDLQGVELVAVGEADDHGGLQARDGDPPHVPRLNGGVDGGCSVVWHEAINQSISQPESSHPNIEAVKRKHARTLTSSTGSLKKASRLCSIWCSSTPGSSGAPSIPWFIVPMRE